MKTILVVDDRPVQLKSIKRGLAIHGFRVVEARGGPDALEHIYKNPEIELVLTDFSMPGMNGIELLINIRRSNPTIPVILMTAFGEKGLKAKAMHHGCNGFIEKPFDMDQLLEIINSSF